MTFNEAIGIDVRGIDKNTGREVPYDEQIGRCIELLGGLEAFLPIIPFSVEDIRKAAEKDPYLNNLSLHSWDQAAGFKDIPHSGQVLCIGGPFLNLCAKAGVTDFCCGENVSILKEAAKRIAGCQPKAEPKMRLFVDMDGVMAKWRSTSKVEELMEEGFFADMYPQRQVIEAVQSIAEEGKAAVFVLSKYLEESPYALAEKNEWLDKYIPIIDGEHRLFCPCNKQKADMVPDGIQEWDVLLDDYTVNLNEWVAAGGIGLKLMNGVNGTKGTWKGRRVAAELAEDIVRAVYLCRVGA